MAISLKRARDFVYSNGVLWERDLFAYLFQAGDLKHLQRSLQAHQNGDGGYGNALEHDVRCPQSNPAALEFLLGVLVQCDLPPGSILDGVGDWVARSRQDDGSLRNPLELLDYPHAPWWNEGGQTTPDSIVGNLIKYGKASDDLRESTMRWSQANRSLENIAATDWLFMAYHAYDYYMNEDRFPDVETYRDATVKLIVKLAENAPERQYHSLFRFAPTPDSRVARAMPESLLTSCLDHLQATQQDDGGWTDQHDLAQWKPYVTIANLLALRSYGRDIGA
jgi:hypothetical protein